MPPTKNMKRARFLRAYQAQQAANRAEMLQARQSPLDPTLPTPVSPQIIIPSHNLIPTDEISLPPSTAESDAVSDAGIPPPNTPLIHSHQPPPIPLVQRVIPELEARVNPRRKSGAGHQPSKLNPLALKDLSSVLELFRLYTSKDIKWRDAALDVSRSKGKGKGHAETLCRWARACLKDPSYIPRTSYGKSQDPIIKCDEFRGELSEFLCSVGKYVNSNNVIQFTSQRDVQEHWGFTKAVSKATAKRWMKDLDYRWRRQPRGLYFDGHERPDVVDYRQNNFLRRWNEMLSRMQSYAVIEVKTYTPMDPIIRRIVVWYHDECTFFSYDRRLFLWIKLMSDSVEPGRKGEGLSLMVSDFVSAEYGWLYSPDGQERAREYFRAGKNRDGYFSSSNVCNQVAHAADMLARYYPGEDHVFVFDNSPTHLKRGPDAPSAQRMPKYTPKPGSKNFLVQTADENGNKIEVPMTGAYFSDGQPQSLYWPEGHERAGWFKGMAEILRERGWENADKIRAKCQKCDPARTDCCLRRILFNEPDFVNPASVLERLVTSRGHGFLLLPKFHPELNPIEQCWAKAKKTFRDLPEPKGQDWLERNVEIALGSVKLDDIRRYCTRSRRICDGYMKGLDGRLSVWAAKLYHGHRVYPEKILEEVERMLEARERVKVRSKL